MDNMLKDYIEAGKALQEKYDEIRRGIVTHQRVLEEDFKPIIRPLQAIKEQLPPIEVAIKENRSTPIEGKTQLSSIESHPPPDYDNDYEKIFGPLASHYLGMHASKKSLTDTTFGIYMKGNQLFIGNTPISIENDNIILENGLDGYKFKGTSGLWELVTLKDPQNYNNEDIDNYEQIILTTCAYRRNNDPTEKVKGSSGKKYKTIIQPILANRGLLKNVSAPTHIFNTPPPKQKSLYEELVEADDDDPSLTKRGKGFGLRKILTNAPVDMFIGIQSMNYLIDCTLFMGKLKLEILIQILLTNLLIFYKK